MKENLCQKKIELLQSKQSRDTTNFVLGFDKVAYMTTTQDYKTHNVKDVPNQDDLVFDMGKSHIPDFCPEYAECRKTKPSEYQVSFTIDPNQPSTASKTTAEDRKKHTNDLRSTHFQLGSCSDSKTSETGHSFCEMPKIEQPEMPDTSERCKSTVFRPGDWNSNDRKMITHSVTKSDFLGNEEKPNVPKDTESSVIFNQRATHFQLGSEQNKNESIYKKDFMTSPNLLTFKPALASAPTPAMVIPKDTDLRFESTLQRNFGNCDPDLMLKMKEERKRNSEENKMKNHMKNNVPISFKKEETSSNISQQLKSTTTCHFHQPLQKEENKPFSGVPEYNHFTSNYNGVEATQSETKARYVDRVVEKECKELREKCQLQFKDNKTTHFDFGIDNNETESEHSSQYQKHLPLDPSLPAAGKGLPEKKHYQHIHHCYTDEKNELKSVMKKDYLPIEDKVAAERVQVETLPTHFFHMDNNSKGTQNSTTKTDFVAPEVF